MLSLSPAKLLIIFVLAIILVGPDKLPQVARQLGAGWHALRRFQQKVEAEVRDTVPDLPPTHDIARFARSPVAFLNSLADLHVDEELQPDPGATPTADPTGHEVWPADPEAANGHGPPVAGAAGVAANGASADSGAEQWPPAEETALQPPGDPSLN